MATGNQPSDYFSDPKFYALPEDVQRATLSYKDPRFRALPLESQKAVIANRHANYFKDLGRQQQAFNDKLDQGQTSESETAAPQGGIIPRAEEYVKSFFKTPPKPAAMGAAGGAPIDEERNAKAQEEFRLAHAGDNLPPKPASAPAEPVAAHKPVNLPPPTAAERLHVEQPGKTEIGPVNPGFWQRVWNSVAGPTTVAGKVIRGEQGIPLDTPVVDPSALFENMGYNKTTASRIAGGLRDASEFVGGMSSVPNLEVIAASGGAGTIAKGLFGKIAESGVSRLISAGFGAQLLYGLYKSVPEFKKALDSGDEVEARNIAIVGGLSGYFGVKALQHAAGLAGDEASKTPKSEEGGTQGPPAPAAQAQTPTAPPPTPKQPTSPHLDNAVASPEPGRKWSDVLVDKGNLVSSKGGVDHYTVGDRHVIVNEGNVYERPAKAAPRFANSLRKANELKENVPGAHLDNAVGSPSPGEKWSDFLLDKADLVESKDGIDHYKRGGMHYIVEPSGAVHTVKGPEGQRFFDTLARAEKFKAHEDEPTKPPAPTAGLHKATGAVTGEHNGVQFTTGKTSSAHYGSIRIGDRIPSDGRLIWKVLAYQPVLDLPEGEGRLAEVGGTADDPWVIIETGADAKQRVALTESGKAPKPQGGTPTAVSPPASAERRGAPRPAGTPALDLATRHEVRTLMQLDPSITFDEAVQATMDAREAAKNAKPVERVKGLPRPPKPASVEPPKPSSLRTYDEVQEDIDKLEDDPEEVVRRIKEGIPDTPELQALYAERDAIGGAELKQSIDEISSALDESGFPPKEVRLILKAFSLDPDDLSAGAQYMAGEHGPKNVSEFGYAKRRAQDIAISLAMERSPLGGREIGDVTDIRDPKVLADAKRAVNVIYQHITGNEDIFDDAKKAGEPPVPKAYRKAPPELTAVLHKEPPTLAGVTVDPEQRVVVTDPKAFVNSLSSGAAPPKGTIVIPTASLTLSPKEMQFRSAEGIVARGAATGPIDTWRPDFAKAIDVWFDPADGKVKVVNGHWRTENAQRLGIDTMKVDFIEATSVSDARAWGALKNIADKTATPYDAAVFFRETGFTPEDLAKSAIPVEGDIARKGLALSRLSDDVFERVRNGDLTMQAGAAIGAALPDHDMQRGLADLVQRERDRGKRLSSQEITALADGRVRRAGKTESTTDTLFGPETVSNSNAVEAARLESWVKGQLAKDKKLFGFVADQKRADRLGTAGNKINVDANRKIASEATAAEEAFTRLLYKSGEVDDAILDGAARIARGEDEHAVRENVYGRVKAAVQKALAGDKGASSPVGEGVTRTGEAAAKPGAGVPVSEPGGGANGGGAAAHEPVRGENGGRPEPGNVESSQRRVAEEPAAGGPASAGGLVSEAQPGEGRVEAPNYGNKNKLTSTDQADVRRARIRSKLNRPNIGIDPEMLADVSYLALYHFEAGARAFGAWSEKMKGELGEWIAPHLDRLWSFVSHRVSTAEALAGVKPATIHVPLDSRPPVREASEWSLSLDEGNIQSTAPAPKVKLSDENAKKLVYFGQKELAELALSALTNPSIDKPGFVLASSTGTGKTFISSAIMSELKPKLSLSLTTNQGLVDKTIAVGREFGLDIQRLPPSRRGVPPEGNFITTYSGAIGYPGLESHPWNLVMADESDSGRKWWSSKTGKLLRQLSQRADKSLFMSATPFHTPVEVGYADNLGLWKKGDFEKWVSQFGVYQDENGDWVAPSNPKRFAKLRLQMTDAGVFINLTPNLDGYTASFGVVPMSPEHRAQVGDIKKAFDTAVTYFQNRGSMQMARAARAGRVVYTKAFLERARLPQAIEIAKKGREKGWSVGIFTETRSASEELYPFLQEADAATHGQIRKLLPPLPDVIEVLRDAFGPDLANFSGSHSEMRQAELEAFNKGEKPVIASTYAAGGRGVDMNDTSGVRPRLAIYLGPPWSGVMFDQAMGRFWRFGTKSDVFAVFLTSDSKAEFDLVHGKVVPRLASLRALVKGVHDDKFAKQFQNIESALQYSQGGGGAIDADDFVVKVESNSVNHYNRIEIPDATEAHNKGLQIARVDDVKTDGDAFGAGNTVFTKDKAEVHKENITDHMNELRSGVDPSMMHDLLYIGGYYAEGGLREFGKWSTAMVDKFGDSVRQYLPEVWKAVNDRLKGQEKLRAPKKVRPEEPVLPGFAPAVEEQKSAAAAETGRKLTSRFNEGPMSIDVGAGRVEASPLFRGTEAAPQTEMFAQPPRPSSLPPEPTAGLHKQGPGGKTEGPPEVAGTPLEQLTSAIASTGKAAKVKQPNTTVPLPPEIKGEEPPSKTLKAVTDAVTGAWKLYSALPPTGSFIDALGVFQGHLQRNTFAMQQFAKEMMKQFPDKSRREAMANWVQAEGDNDTLLRWATLSKGKVRKAYQAAMTLTDEEKTAAQNVRNMFDSYWDVAHNAGVLESFIENYIPQLRKPASKFTSRVLAEVMGGILRTDFKFAKKRVYETYFDGEQAGHPALDKDVAFLTTTYVRALVKAIEGRAMVRKLLESYAEDGRPLATVSGAGRVVTDPETGQRANFVNPNIKPELATDYRSISHPALRRWIWTGRDARGNGISLQGDIVIHPEIFKHLRNVLKQSAFREPDAEWYKRLGGVALDASSFAKQSFMGPLSTFHQAQVALHGLMHQVNPFNPPPIDWENPDQVGLVNGGMVVASPDGAVNFEEGLVAGGIWDQIPVAGNKLRAYKDYLFKDYIPRLKMSMGMAALERNRKTYGGKMSADQIYRLTASEANAAFGEQNYIMMGRNKTVQDALRLVMLSPDFTESRARFVAQALRPGGREQLRALALGSVALAVSAYSLSHLLKAVLPGKKVEWHQDRPFSVRVGEYEFDVRSLPGDLLEAMTEPRKFLQGRENPVTAKPVDEAVTGKDWRGQPRTFGEQVHDYFYGLVPISLQGLTEEGRTAWESALGAFGLRARKFYSAAGRKALEIHGEDMAAKSRRHETPEIAADRKEVSKLFQSLNDGVPVPQEEIAKLEAEGKISGYTAARLRKAKPGDDRFLNIFSSLGIEDKLDVWDKADDDERKTIAPELRLTGADLRQLKSMPPNESKRVMARYKSTLNKWEHPKKETGIAGEAEHIFDQIFAPIPSGSARPPVPVGDNAAP